MNDSQNAFAHILQRGWRYKNGGGNDFVILHNLVVSYNLKLL